MSRTRVLSAAVLSVGLMTAAASAALNPTIVYVPKTGTSSQGNGTLNNSRTFSVQVAQTTTTEFFASGDLQFTTSGASGGSRGLLNYPGGSDTRTFGGAAGTDFDSYVTTPGTTNAGTANRTLVLGGGTSPLQHGAQVAQLPNSTDPRIVDISWGDPQGINTGGSGPAAGTVGTFEVARLTLLPNTAATVAGRIVSVLPAGTATSSTFSAIGSGAAGFISAVVGDSNNDGQANSTDYFRLVSQFGTASSNGVTDGDFNEDGQVNSTDYFALVGNFGFSYLTGAALPGSVTIPPLPGSVVPEPATLGLIGLASVGLLRRRK